MENIEQLLESTCKTMIQTILACLDNAVKGTIYRIGPMPKLTAVRITSGVRRNDSEEIQWGLPTASDYTYPGKNWEQYRDQPGRPLEAMGWCVERQTSWTADNPYEDVRSVRKQIRGEIEDCYHMEPVLIRKAEVPGASHEGQEYPLDGRGERIWQDKDFVVVAVIKIHFLPYTIRRDDKATRIIRELSMSLGSELLSLHLRETLAQAQKEFTRQRLQSCEILAHDLRNTLIKLGFVFPAINAQISIVRDVWEELLEAAFPAIEWKETVLAELDELVRRKLHLIPPADGLRAICDSLLANQNELGTMRVLPQQGEQWVKNRIRPKWEQMLSQSRLWDRGEVSGLLARLGAALKRGTDSELIEKLDTYSPELRREWVDVAYTGITSDNLEKLDEALDLLEKPDLPVRHKPQIRKALKSLKALVVTIPEVEETANRIIQTLRFGGAAELELVSGLDEIFGQSGRPDDFGLSD